MEQKTIKSFTDLIAWQVGHKVVLKIYEATSKYPKSENFTLVDQLRRCTISITSNIAEGFSRKSKKEKMQFYYTSLGSITELQNQLLISRDLGYLTEDLFQELAQLTIRLHKLVNGIIKSSTDYT